MIHFIGCRNLSKLKEMKRGLKSYGSSENVKRSNKLFLKSLKNLGRGDSFVQIYNMRGSKIFIFVSEGDQKSWPSP